MGVGRPGRAPIGSPTRPRGAASVTDDEEMIRAVARLDRQVERAGSGRSGCSTAASSASPSSRPSSWGSSTAWSPPASSPSRISSRPPGRSRPKPPPVARASITWSPSGRIRPAPGPSPSRSTARRGCRSVVPSAASSRCPSAPPRSSPAGSAGTLAIRTGSGARRTGGAPTRFARRGGAASTRSGRSPAGRIPARPTAGSGRTSRRWSSTRSGWPPTSYPTSPGSRRRRRGRRARSGSARRRRPTRRTRTATRPTPAESGGAGAASQAGHGRAFGPAAVDRGGRPPPAGARPYPDPPEAVHDDVEAASRTKTLDVVSPLGFEPRTQGLKVRPEGVSEGHRGSPELNGQHETGGRLTARDSTQATVIPSVDVWVDVSREGVAECPSRPFLGGRRAVRPTAAAAECERPGGSLREWVDEGGPGVPARAATPYQITVMLLPTPWALRTRKGTTGQAFRPARRITCKVVQGRHD